MNEILFILAGLLTVSCAFGVVFARNPVYSAFALVNAFFGLAFLYLLWGSSFMAAIQILIYTGAIVVLFVFVVMLLNLGRSTNLVPSNWMLVGLSSAFAWLFALLLLRSLNGSVAVQGVAAVASFKALSLLLFERFLWPFEILTFFLLALIVGIFALARADEQSE